MCFYYYVSDAWEGAAKHLSRAPVLVPRQQGQCQEAWPPALTLSPSQAQRGRKARWQEGSRQNRWDPLERVSFPRHPSCSQASSLSGAGPGPLQLLFSSNHSGTSPATKLQLILHSSWVNAIDPEQGDEYKLPSRKPTARGQAQHRPAHPN